MKKLTNKVLQTTKGEIRFPAFFPVTTFGGKFPLDQVVRPHLFRVAPAVMVSHFYAQKMPKQGIGLPVFIDSGGFASLFKGAEIIEDGKTAYIRTVDGTVTKPADVLAFQEAKAEIGATLDFIVPPNMEETEAIRRQELTIKNALWALKHKERKDFKLFASVQAWDAESAKRIMQALASQPFNGFALGGMVPRLGKPEEIFAIVAAIRKVDNKRPLHLFGIGQPCLIRELFKVGVDSVDSSSYVQQAAGKKYLHPKKGAYEALDKISFTDVICDCAVCRTFTKEYLELEGELNTMALAIHNLETLTRITNTSHSSSDASDSSLASPAASLD